nr:membrane dipeptidase [Desulfuromonadales bacterium]
MLIVDGLQYCNWSERIFRQMREGGVGAVHVTIAYWEDFRETVERIIEWQRRFQAFGELITPLHTADDL